MKYTGNDNLEIMKIAKNYNEFLISLAINIIKKHSYKKILDFGCSDGFFIEQLTEKLNTYICGIEIDDTALKKCFDKKLNVTNNIDNINKKLDFIYSFNVLEHIADDVKLLKTLKEKLSDNGRILIYVPAMMFLYSSMDKKVGHYRRYEKKDLKAKMEKAGFNIEKIEYCDSVGVLVTILYKIKDTILSNEGKLNPLALKIYDKIFPFVRILDNLFFKYLCGKNIVVVANCKK